MVEELPWKDSKISGDLSESDEVGGKETEGGSPAQAHGFGTKCR